MMDSNGFVALRVFFLLAISHGSVAAFAAESCEKAASEIASRLQTEAFESVRLVCVGGAKGVAEKPQGSGIDGERSSNENKESSTSRHGKVKNRIVQHKLRKMFFATHDF